MREIRSEVMEAIQEQDGKTMNRALSRFGHALTGGTLLAVSCLISYWIATTLLSRGYSVSRDNVLLGGMWASIATIFVFRQTYDESARAALSRTLATLLSFSLCLGYFLVLPFHVLGMVMVIGLGSVILTLAHRTEHIITTGITTAVVFVVAGISPEHAWIQPVLRLVDTAVGIAVGLAISWVSLAIGFNPASRREA
jgi:uncharacterized membrane protein YgaE (UPF0421/DUF939 family)